MSQEQARIETLVKELTQFSTSEFESLKRVASQGLELAELLRKGVTSTGLSAASAAASEPSPSKPLPDDANVSNKPANGDEGSKTAPPAKEVPKATFVPRKHLSFAKVGEFYGPDQRYQLIDKIASSETTQVFEVFDRRMQTNVVFKIAPYSAEGYQQVKANKASDLVVPIHDINKLTEELMYLTMDKMDTTLDDHRNLSLADGMDVLFKIISGVSAIHKELGTPHQDLKPSNIGVKLDKETGKIKTIKILDFGLAGYKSAPPGSELGTKKYAPPELRCYDPARASFPVDIYAIGVIGFELIPNAIRIPALSTLLNKAMSDDPALRPTAEVLKSQLHNVSIHHSQHTMPAWLDFPSVFAVHTKGYRPEDVVCRWLAEDTSRLYLDIPEGYEEMYRTVMAGWEQAVKNPPPGKVIFNGDMLAIKSVSETRTSDLDEHPRLVITFARTKYFHYQAILHILNHIRTKEKEKFTNTVQSSFANLRNPIWSNSFGTHVGIISSDNKLMFLKRSTKLTDKEGLYTCGIAEGMSLRDVEGGLPAPYSAAVRGIKEEVGITVDRKRITFTGIGFRADDNVWGLVGFADLRNGSEAENRAYHSKVIEAGLRLGRGKDALFENGGVEFVDLNPAAVVAFLRRAGHFESGAIGCAWAILYNNFENQVEDVLWQNIVHSETSPDAASALPPQPTLGAPNYNS